jgi:glycerophosphoryl diester phosphodiesterase
MEKKMKNTIKINSKNVKMIAHRGLSGLEKENTCRAFVAAGNREKYYGIETDVHRTSDGKYVVIHDEHTKRLAGIDMNICESTFEQLRNIILTDLDGSRDKADLRIPSLEEYIEICKKYGKIAILELKDNFCNNDVDEIIEIIKNLDYFENTIFISFFKNPLIYIRKLYPNHKLQFLSGEFNNDIFELLKENKLDFDCYFPILNERNMKLLKDAGIEVNAWTCDTEEEANRLISLGVDYITTNILE